MEPLLAALVNEKTMMVVILFLSMAFAVSDPWHRPAHLRVIPQPPETFADALSLTVRHRLWWDDVNTTAEIQVQTHTGWKRLTKHGKPGWLSKPLPRGSLFRVRINNTSLRWSQPVYSRKGVSPLDWARLGGDGLYSDVVSEIVF